MKNTKWMANVLCLMVILNFADAASATACNKRLGGSWQFGSSPSACAVEPASASVATKSQYGPVVFDDAQTNTAGRNRYMSEMFPVLRDLGSFYIHRRKPGVSPAEEEGFLAGLYTLATQESNWTHYRWGTDLILRAMRGDSLHGYGMMQVDDRSHAVAIAQGKGVDMVENVLYGLDNFYAQWVSSAHVSCVASSTDYKSRARSAWSAYNGGPGSICRWKNSKSPYAPADREFNRKYDARAWLTYTKDVKAKSPLDVRCLAEGKRPCAAPAGFGK